MSSRLLVCAPLGCEARALRNGLDADVVLKRTGYGPKRSARSVVGLAAKDFDALAIAGLAGGLGETVGSGDVVVSTEIRGAGRIVRCPSAPLVAGELRRSGFTVHCGPTVSEDHVVSGSERAALASSGALAVDMESAQLAVLSGLSGRRPVISVRVVVDTDRQPFVDLRSFSRLSSALANVRGLGSTLSRWGQSVGGRHAVLATPLPPRPGKSGNCDATSHPPAVLRDGAQRVDLLLVPVPSDSSYSRRRIGAAWRCRNRAYLVSDVADVELAWLRDATAVGITVGASAPPDLVDQLIATLRGLGPLEVIEHRTTEESIQFGLPKEVSG